MFLRSLPCAWNPPHSATYLLLISSLLPLHFSLTPLPPLSHYLTLSSVSPPSSLLPPLFFLTPLPPLSHYLTLSSVSPPSSLLPHSTTSPFPLSHTLLLIFSLLPLHFFLTPPPPLSHYLTLSSLSSPSSLFTSPSLRYLPFPTISHSPLYLLPPPSSLLPHSAPSPFPLSHTLLLIFSLLPLHFFLTPLPPLSHYLTLSFSSSPSFLFTSSSLLPSSSPPPPPPPPPSPPPPPPPPRSSTILSHSVSPLLPQLTASLLSF